MTAENDVRPYHANDPAKGQETADAVAAVLKHAADRDDASHQKAGVKKQPRWLLPIGINLMVLALYFLVAPPTWVVLDPLEGPDVVTQSRDTRVAMWFGAQAIHSFAARNEGRLPASLSEVSASKLPSDTEYRVQGDTFQLVVSLGDEVLVYDSARPDPAFAAEVSRGMNRMGG